MRIPRGLAHCHPPAKSPCPVELLTFFLGYIVRQSLPPPRALTWGGGGGHGDTFEGKGRR